MKEKKLKSEEKTQEPTVIQFIILTVLLRIQQKLELQPNTGIPADLVNGVVHLFIPDSSMIRKLKALQKLAMAGNKLFTETPDGYAIDPFVAKIHPQTLRGASCQFLTPAITAETAADNLLSHWKAGTRDLQQRCALEPYAQTTPSECPIPPELFDRFLRSLELTVLLKGGDLDTQEFGNLVSKHVRGGGIRRNLKTYLQKMDYVRLDGHLYVLTDAGRERIKKAARSTAFLTEAQIRNLVLNRQTQVVTPPERIRRKPSRTPEEAGTEERTNAEVPAQIDPERTTQKPSESVQDEPAPARVTTEISIITEDPATWPERELEPGGTRDEYPRKQIPGVEISEIDWEIERQIHDHANRARLRIVAMCTRRLSPGQFDGIRASITRERRKKGERVDPIQTTAPPPTPEEADGTSTDQTSLETSLNEGSRSETPEQPPTDETQNPTKSNLMTQYEELARQSIRLSEERNAASNSLLAATSEIEELSNKMIALRVQMNMANGRLRAATDKLKAIEGEIRALDAEICTLIDEHAPKTTTN